MNTVRFGAWTLRATEPYWKILATTSNIIGIVVLIFEIFSHWWVTGPQRIKDRLLGCSDPCAHLIEGTGLPITRAASSNQNATNGIPREKLEEWMLCLTRKLKKRNRAKRWWTWIKPLKYRDQRRAWPAELQNTPDPPSGCHISQQKFWQWASRQTVKERQLSGPAVSPTVMLLVEDNPAIQLPPSMEKSLQGGDWEQWSSVPETTTASGDLQADNQQPPPPVTAVQAKTVTHRWWPLRHWKPNTATRWSESLNLPRSLSTTRTTGDLSMASEFHFPAHGVHTCVAVKGL